MAGFLGHKHSLGTIEKLRQIALRPEARQRSRDVRLGQITSPETRERIRQSSLNHMKSPEVRERLRQVNLGKHHSPETREKLRQNTLRQWRDPEFRERIRQARLLQTFPQKMTSIERLLRDEFKKRRLRFEMHKTMFGRFQPDFVFESAKLIVQADGDYWHGPGSVNAKRDNAFNVAAAAEGWSVWRFGEREIEMHAPACARAVARFLRDH